MMNLVERGGAQRGEILFLYFSKPSKSTHLTLPAVRVHLFIQNMLIASGLCKSFGDETVFTDANLTVAQGEVVFLTGPSGCGKSTLLRVLADLEPVDSGKIAVSGVQRGDISGNLWRTIVSYVPQSRTRLQDSPIDLFNRAQGFKARRQPQRHALLGESGDLVGLCGKLGLDESTIRKGWNDLSGGQAQRASLAISMALGGRVLLLDEVTSACDAANTILVERAVSESGCAVLWVSHDPQQPARVGGRVIALP